MNDNGFYFSALISFVIFRSDCDEQKVIFFNNNNLFKLARSLSHSGIHFYNFLPIALLVVLTVDEIGSSQRKAGFNVELIEWS